MSNTGLQLAATIKQVFIKGVPYKKDAMLPIISEAGIAQSV
jgi:hypothetical protein